jgi:hypothetical protein
VSRRLVARAGVLAAAALVASGCGSDGSDATDETQQIPAEVADDLAAQSDAIAETLVQGDDCAARDQAIALRDDVNQRIEEGDVPAELQPEMRRRAKDLVASIHCDPPAPPPPPPPPPPTDYEEEEDD